MLRTRLHSKYIEFHHAEELTQHTVVVISYQFHVRPLALITLEDEHPPVSYTFLSRNVLGIHLNNIIPQLTNPRVLLKQAVLAVWPSLLLEAHEQATYSGQMDVLKTLLREMGYMHLQATRPDTVGESLMCDVCTGLV